MLYLIPAPLHRAGLRLAHALRRRWWRLRAPTLEGVRVLAIDGAGQVLLIRHSYVPDKWMPPGGGLRRGEEPLAAAARELREETGCALEHPRRLEVALEDLHGAGNRVHVVAGRALGVPRADMREVIEVRFFAPDALPPNLARALAPALPGWIAVYSSES